MARWITHDGASRPVPLGSMIDIEHFDGQISRRVKVGPVSFGKDGSREEHGYPTLYSGWHYSDGGPMGPKFRRYRLCQQDAGRERNAAMFQSWLKVGSKQRKREAAEQAGMSLRQERAAVRVQNVPAEQFEAAVESQSPSMVTKLADMGRERGGQCRTRFRR